MPRCTWSRSTAAAKDGCFSFFFTDFGFIPSIPVGRTSAQAAMKPESSSTAYSVFAISVSRGTLEELGVAGDGVDHLLRIALLLQLLERVAGMTGLEVGIALVVEVVHQRGDRVELLVLTPLAGVGDHRRLDAQQVLAQGVGLHPLGDQLPCIVS